MMFVDYFVESFSAFNVRKCFFDFGLWGPAFGPRGSQKTARNEIPIMIEPRKGPGSDLEQKPSRIKGWGGRQKS